MGINRRFQVAILVLLYTLVATPGSAQPWRGFSQRNAPFGVGAVVYFGEHSDAYAVEGFTRVSRFTLGAQYTLTRYSVGDHSANTVSVNAAFHPRITQLRQLGVRLWPVAAIDYTFEDQIKTIHIPVGLSVAYGIPLAEDLKLQPYVIPELVYYRVNYDYAGGTTESGTDFAWVAGGNLKISNLAFGAFYRKVGEANGNFGVNVAWFMRRVPPPE
jgi:hypothetical protein